MAMTLTLYNTLTRRKELFEPIAAGFVQMYCCGVTVYDYCHLGHARSYIVWDVVRRYLQWKGYKVRYVQNFTDIDDKILKRAKEDGSSMQAVADRYIEAYRDDMARLNILPADAYPKATEVIPQIIDLIKALISDGYAYAVDGDVYYAVERFPNYGKLSGRHLEQMEAGASGRVDDTEPKKRHPLDFALWKAAKAEEMAVYTPWESPWGLGRPGWHIECSAMVREAFAPPGGGRLGETIDIHAGGMDLIFPHHENEIAQSEGATRKSLSKYWLHNGFVNIRGEKMSKSLNNFKTIRDLLRVYDPMALRVFVLQAHYRKPLDFTEEAMNAAQNSWSTLNKGIDAGSQLRESLGWSSDETDNPEALDAQAVEHFKAAMDDDFNSPIALAVLFELAKELQRENNILRHQGATGTEPEVLERKWRAFIYLLKVLGFKIPETITGDVGMGGITTITGGVRIGCITTISVIDGLSDAAIEDMIEQRAVARKAKDFAESDRIRDELNAKGITLIDQPGGVTRWHRKTP
jgi:cysteinyl-tRNA synthetase